MDTLCYNSSDPVAVNATVLFDFDINEVNLWTRADPAVPLPPCSSSSPPDDAQCTVCRDHIVFAVCRKLADGVKMTMEAGTHQVNVLQSECPRMLSDVGPELPSDDAPQWLLPVVLTFILLLLLLLLSLVVYCCYWRRPSFSRVNSGQRRLV